MFGTAGGPHQHGRISPRKKEGGVGNQSKQHLETKRWRGGQFFSPRLVNAALGTSPFEPFVPPPFRGPPFSPFSKAGESPRVCAVRGAKGVPSSSLRQQKEREQHGQFS